MLHPEDFNNLPEQEQHDLLLDGNFLADREENGLMVQLFSFRHFYVERYYDRHANRILRVQAFKDTSRLVPYIAHIRFDVG
jgi:hypothetical protein